MPPATNSEVDWIKLKDFNSSSSPSSSFSSSLSFLNCRQKNKKQEEESDREIGPLKSNNKTLIPQTKKNLKKFAKAKPLTTKF